jgi:hypothetical protein
MSDYFDLTRVNNVYHFEKSGDMNGREIEVGDLVRIQMPPEIYGTVAEITAPSGSNDLKAVRVVLNPKLHSISTTNTNVTLKSKGIK